jgi:hypothetical protein
MVSRRKCLLIQAIEMSLFRTTFVHELKHALLAIPPITTSQKSNHSQGKGAGGGGTVANFRFQKPLGRARLAPFRANLESESRCASQTQDSEL